MRARTSSHINRAHARANCDVATTRDVRVSLRTGLRECTYAGTTHIRTNSLAKWLSCAAAAGERGSGEVGAVDGDVSKTSTQTAPAFF